MEPLIIVTCHNRLDLTKQTLDGLVGTVVPGEAVVAIVNDGSADGTRDFLDQWAEGDGAPLSPYVFHPGRIGCPRGLNLAIDELRKKGQPVVKLDNDVVITSVGWVREVSELMNTMKRTGATVGLCQLWGSWLESKRKRVNSAGVYAGAKLVNIWPSGGYCTWHTHELMDRVRFFDVLAPDHIYGFEDNLMSFRAHRLGLSIISWQGWAGIDLQDSSALGGAKRDAHVVRMRQAYTQRVNHVQSGGTIINKADGFPANRR